MQQTLCHSMKQLLVLLGRHFISFLTVATVLQLGMTYLGGYLLKYLFRCSLYLANQSNLDQTNILYLFQHPTSVTAIFIFILCFSALFFVELSVLIYVIYARQQKKQISYRAVTLHALGRMRHLFGLNFFFFLFYILISLPLAGGIMQFSLMNRLYIPSFIIEEFMKSPLGLVMLALGFGILIYLNLRFIYAMPLMMIEDQRFIRSLQESWQLTRHKKWKLILTFCFLFFIISLLSFGIIWGLTSLFESLDQTGDNLLIQTLFLSSVKFMLFFIPLLIKIGTLIILIDQVVTPDFSQDVRLIQPIHHQRRHWIVLLVFGLIFVKIGQNAILLAQGPEQHTMLTIGHRGYVAKAVENSLEGLEAAAQEGADAVEVDVQLTQDQGFVVMHDSRLQRLAGSNQQVANMTYDQIVGRTLKQNGHESTIPSFEAFVKRAQELHIKLLIEFKPHGHEPDNYADLVIQELRRLGIAQTYPIMSLNRQLMDQVKDKAPEIKTGYIIPIQFGEFADSRMDFYVLEEFSYRTELAQQARKEGKEIYVWTLNDPDKIQYFMSQPIQGIISDELGIIKEIKTDLATNQTYFDRAWRLLVGF